MARSTGPFRWSGVPGRPPRGDDMRAAALIPRNVGAAPTSAVVDACIAGHQASGLRTVYCYAETRDDTVRNYNPTDTGRTPSQPAFPGDLARLQKTYFSSRDQLLTLRLGDTRAENFALARRHGLGITCDAVFGVATPLRSNNWSPRLRQMAAQGELGPDLALIHGTGIPSDVFALLAKHGVAMILAPTSDAVLRGLGDSLTPVQQVIDHGMLERSGISTDNDVALSNARWQRGEADSPAPMSVRDVLTLATKGGAYAVGLGDRVGTLSPGKAADIIMIRCNDLSLGPLNNAYGSVVVGANPENVDTVMIGGQARKRHRELVAIDQSALMRRLVSSRDHIGAASGLWRPSDALGGQPAN